jgi:prepilin-type processing-associated H-X9-DG protein
MHHSTKNKFNSAGYRTSDNYRQSWPPQLWPYMEESDVLAQWTFNQHYFGVPNAYPVTNPNQMLKENAPAAHWFPAYDCPSDRGRGLYLYDYYRVRGNYVLCWGPYEYQPNTKPKVKGPFGYVDYYDHHQPRHAKTKDFVDGTSHTMMMSEVLMHPRDESVDGRGDILSEGSDAIYSTINTPNSSAPDGQWGPYCDPVLPDFPCNSVATGPNGRPVHAKAISRHPGGVNVGFADGSGSFVRDTIALAIWQAFSTIDGGESASSSSY